MDDENLVKPKAFVVTKQGFALSKDLEAVPNNGFSTGEDFPQTVQ